MNCGPNHWQRIRQACHDKNVLEYGTNFTEELVNLQKPDCRLVSVEHDLDRFIKVCTDIVTFYWPLHLPMRELYVSVPLNYAPFETVVVDGRWRCRCLQAVKHWLSKDARVFLHDSSREWYKPGKEGYETIYEEADPEWEENPEATLWEGRLK